MKLEDVIKFLNSRPGYLKVGDERLAKRIGSTVATCREAKKFVKENMEEVIDTPPIENMKIKKAWKYPGSQKWGVSYALEDEVDYSKLDELLENAFSKIELIDIPRTTTEKKGSELFIYLSDQHIGAEVKNAQYENEYNNKVVHQRMRKLVSKISELDDIFYVSKIYLVVLGDSLDGMNSLTTRGGHTLPQNMNNIEAFECFISSHTNLLYNLSYICSNIDVHLTSNSNHGGDFEYIANRALQMYFKDTEHIDIKVYTKFINHFETNNYCYIITHGKDKKNLKYGMPKNLNEKVEIQIAQYIREHSITKPVKVIKGDLHLYNYEYGKLFEYKNVPSFFGGSGWVSDNFGKTIPGVAYEIQKDGFNLSGKIDLI